MIVIKIPVAETAEKRVKTYAEYINLPATETTGNTSSSTPHCTTSEAIASDVVQWGVVYLTQKPALSAKSRLLCYFNFPCLLSRVNDCCCNVCRNDIVV